MRLATAFAAVVWVCLLLCGVGALSAAEIAPLEGENFPDLLLPAPGRMDEAEFLGLTQKARFNIEQVKAEVVILEIYSMYCPYCQKEAPAVNSLLEAIEKRNLGERIKIVGIGAGNSPFEVNAFRNLYNVRFPLLSDSDYRVHKALGSVRTPHFFVLKQKKNGPSKVIYSKVGTFGDPIEFLDLVISKAGLGRGK